MEARPGTEFQTRVQIYAAAWLKILGTRRLCAPVDDYTLTLLTSLEKVLFAQRPENLGTRNSIFEECGFLLLALANCPPFY